jgi:phage FluMu protein Com
MIEVSKGQKSYSGIGIFIPLSLIHCKKCGNDIILGDIYQNAKDMGAQCERCKAVNLITMEDGELKEQSLQDI